MPRTARVALLALSLLPVLACGGPPEPAKGKPPRSAQKDGKTDGKDTKIDAKKVEKLPSQAADAKAFVDKVDGELREFVVAVGKAEWDKNTNITDATANNGFIQLSIKEGVEDYSFVPQRLISAGYRLSLLREEDVNLETAFMRLTRGMVQ